MHHSSFKSLKIAGIALLVSFILLACQTGHKSKQDEFTKYEGREPAKLLADADRALKDGRYHEALAQFDAITYLYPDAKEVKQARLDSIYARYKMDELPATIVEAKQFLVLYPEDPGAAYALYVQGVANMNASHGFLVKYLPIAIAQRDLSNEREAFEAFSQLLKNYPKSPYVQDARQRMIYLRNLLAEHELAIADYYWRSKAYVAAANRANYIILHYAESSSTPKALALLAKAYQRLHMPAQARAVQQIHNANFKSGS